VHYSPDDPAESVLMPGAYFTSYLLFIIGATFLVIGCILLLIPSLKFAFPVFGLSSESQPATDELYSDFGTERRQRLWDQPSSGAN